MSTRIEPKVEDFRLMPARPGFQAWHYPGVGVIVRRGYQFWLSNDLRWDLVGVSPNQELCQPTVGPFRSRREALLRYYAER